MKGQEKHFDFIFLKMRYLVLIGAFPFKTRLRISCYTVAELSCSHVQRKIIRQKSHRVKKMKLYFSCGSMIQKYNYCLSFEDIISVDKYNYFVCHPLTNS